MCNIEKVDDIFDLETDKGKELARQTLIMFLRKHLVVETTTKVKLKTKFGELEIAGNLYPSLREHVDMLERDLQNLQTLGAQRSIRALIEENLSFSDSAWLEDMEKDVNYIRENLIESIDDFHMAENTTEAFYGISSSDPALKSITDNMEPQEHPPFMKGHDLSVNKEGDSIKIPTEEDIRFLNLEDSTKYKKLSDPKLKKISTKTLILKRN